MKELSVEEKAKAYDGNYKTYTELINRLEDMKNAIKKQNYGIAMDILYKPYPEYQITASSELKESEDEKIRKSLIILLQHFCNGYRVPGLDFPVSYKDMLAWLEKQGEQKTVDEIAKEVCKNKASAITFLKSAGIMNEKGELADEYKIEQDEQNSTWSEEDEDYYDAIISKLEVTQDDALLTDNQMKFLKSLKDRYTWKPSNEQMEGIECTIKTLRYQLNAGDNRLDSLYNDLKKLREE